MPSQCVFDLEGAEAGDSLTGNSKQVALKQSGSMALNKKFHLYKTMIYIIICDSGTRLHLKINV